MITINGQTRYSATDLLNWQKCKHSSRLDSLVQSNPDLRDWLGVQREAGRAALASGDALPEPSSLRGDQHEHAMRMRLAESGLSIVEIARPGSTEPGGLEQAAAQTLQALQSGADVVFQAALLDGPVLG